MLLRFDPFAEIDRMVQQTAEDLNRVPAALAMDAYRRGDQFVVEFDLPGADPASIDLTVEKHVLTVTATRRSERREGDEIVVRERREGTFSRQLFLGDTLDPDRISARYDAGVLTLTIPVAERAKARRVEVTTGPDDKETALEAKASAA